ncbi:hypothetical protein N7467_009204 [Penicillium canescens]|nr:hypothetical protein N7467_009204 [Penicillium canescens]
MKPEHSIPSRRIEKGLWCREGDFDAGYLGRVSAGFALGLRTRGYRLVVDVGLSGRLFGISRGRFGLEGVKDDIFALYTRDFLEFCVA